MINSEQGVVEKIGEDFLVIKFSAGRELLWSKKLIDWDVQEGDRIKIIVSRQEAKNDFPEDQAKNLLKKIFQTNNA